MWLSCVHTIHIDLISISFGFFFCFVPDSFDPSFEDDSSTEVALDGKEKGGGDEDEDEDDNINTAKVFEDGSEENDAETKPSQNRQR